MTRLWLLVFAVLAGCIRAPDVVMVDRQTMLEEQLSGELQPLDDSLRELALVPTAADFTRSQLEAAGVDLGDDTLTQVTGVHAVMLSELERLDGLLVRRCVGEALSGLLEETPATCSGRHNAQRTSDAVHRVNRARRQLWQHLQDKTPSAAPEALRQRWREHHLSSVVCGAQVQAASGVWEVTRC